MRAFIFDMDGVLVDTEHLYQTLNLSWLNSVGVPLTPQEHTRYVGASGHHMWSDLRARYGLTQSVEWLIQAERDRMYEAISGSGPIELIDGIPELLDTLRARAIRVGLATSSERKLVALILSRTGIESYFAASVSGDEITNGKPAPDIYRACARALGVAPRDCVVLEDSQNGVRSATAAGMQVIGFANPLCGTQDLSMAHRVVRQISAEMLVGL